MNNGLDDPCRRIPQQGNRFLLFWGDVNGVLNGRAAAVSDDGEG